MVFVRRPGAPCGVAVTLPNCWLCLVSVKPLEWVSVWLGVLVDPAFGGAQLGSQVRDGLWVLIYVRVAGDADTGASAVQAPLLRAAHLLIQTLLWTLGFLYKVNFGDFILVLKLKGRILAGGGSSWLFCALQKML